jgi:hypothetical protein
MNFVKSHERFHEQAGLFELIGIVGLIDYAAEQRHKVCIDFASPLRVGNLGFQHLDERLLLSEPLFVATDLVLKRHQFVVKAAKLGGFVSISATTLANRFCGLLCDVRIQFRMDRAENDWGDIEPLAFSALRRTARIASELP